MFIGSKHNSDSLNCNTPVLINNQPITRVLSFIFLGVKLDENLNWDEHVEMICNKVGAGRHRSYETNHEICSYKYPPNDL